MATGVLGIVSPGATALFNLYKRKTRKIGLEFDVNESWIHVVLTANYDDDFYVDVVGMPKGKEEAGQRPVVPWTLPWREDRGSPPARLWPVDRDTPRKLNLAEARKNDPTPPGFFNFFSISAPSGWKVWPEGGEVVVSIRARAARNRRADDVTVSLKLDEQARPTVEVLHRESR
jgi:hypothetical protein